MPRLPSVSGREAVKAFSRAGWRPVRQHGSHLLLVKEGVRWKLAVPLHDQLRTGTLRALIKTSGLSVEEFAALL